jgi:hypothetical protein
LRHDEKEHHVPSQRSGKPPRQSPRSRKGPAKLGIKDKYRGEAANDRQRQRQHDADRPDRKIEALAATWVPSADLAGSDGRVSGEFVWSALDCPTGQAAMSARHLGLNGNEPVLLGRMAAQIHQRPNPGDRCIVVAWPTGRDGRKLYANSALLGPDGETLAAAQATWLIVDRQVQLGQQ